jgi:hypothetical protein
MTALPGAGLWFPSVATVRASFAAVGLLLITLITSLASILPL